MRSMMEILQAKSMELSSPVSESSIPVPAEKAPVLQRLEAAMNFMMRDIMASDNTSKKAKFMIGKIWEEAMSELEEAPPELIERSFEQTTALMYWVSTGTVIENVPMPAGFWDHTGSPIPELSAPAPAIEAGANSE